MYLFISYIFLWGKYPRISSLYIASATGMQAAQACKHASNTCRLQDGHLAGPRHLVLKSSCTTLTFLLTSPWWTYSSRTYMWVSFLHPGAAPPALQAPARRAPAWRQQTCHPFEHVPLRHFLEQVAIVSHACSYSTPFHRWSCVRRTDGLALGRGGGARQQDGAAPGRGGSARRAMVVWQHRTIHSFRMLHSIMTSLGGC
jgi:hypothetical protein